MLGNGQIACVESANAVTLKSQVSYTGIEDNPLRGGVLGQSHIREAAHLQSLAQEKSLVLCR